MGAEMDDRKWTILKAIIKTYLETGEPVGSRTISKFPDLNLSSATIRNEMSDLEEMGYILQPHTSAGRIPSDKGYRFYVDRMMQEKDEEVDRRVSEKIREKENEFSTMTGLVMQRQDRTEELLKQIVKYLAANTNYATMITGPQYHRTKLKFIQLSIVSPMQILATTVTEANAVRNKIIIIEHGLDHETVLKLNVILNQSLAGLNIEQINLGTIARLKEASGIKNEVISKVLDAVAEAISEENDVEIYTSGTTNIFKYPELSDSEKASELIGAFEEKNELTEFLRSDGSEARPEDGNGDSGIHVYIGQETQVSSMKDCSVVTATYDMGNGMQGKIGILGPKRMDYGKVIGILKNVTTELGGLSSSGEDAGAEAGTLGPEDTVKTSGGKNAVQPDEVQKG